MTNTNIDCFVTPITGENQRKLFEIMNTANGF